MIEAVEGELTDLSTTAAAPSGKLRLTLPSRLSQSHLTDQIAAFAAAHPRIKLSLDFSDTRRALIEDGFDCAIRMGPKLKPGPCTRKLFEVKRRLDASHAYLAGRPKARAPKDLLNWDWLMLIPAVNIPLEFKIQGSFLLRSGRMRRFIPMTRRRFTGLLVQMPDLRLCRSFWPSGTWQRERWSVFYRTGICRRFRFMQPGM